MNGKFSLRLLATLLLAAPTVTLANNDEAWIIQYMASSSAPGVAPSKAHPRDINFADLAKHSGRRARFSLNDGRERRGIIENARGNDVDVRAQFGGGFFLYTLSRNEVRSIRLD